MMNLIPPQGEHVVKREYVLHVIATLAFLYSGVLIFLTVAFIPVYVLVGAQMETFTAAAEKERDEGQTLKVAEEEIRNAKELLVQLGTPLDEVNPNALIEAIVARADEGIRFTSFGLTETNGTVSSVQVQGVAPTREALVSYTKLVKEDPHFGGADVPIADFVKDSNVPFTMTVTVRPLDSK